jgi:hypothetical protein
MYGNPPAFQRDRLVILDTGLSLSRTCMGSQRDVVYLGWTNSTLVYGPRCGGGGVLRGLSQISTDTYSCAHGAQINFEDLQSTITVCEKGTRLASFLMWFPSSVPTVCYLTVNQEKREVASHFATQPTTTSPYFLHVLSVYLHTVSLLQLFPLPCNGLSILYTVHVYSL